jgi:hypothetical protein
VDGVVPRNQSARSSKTFVHFLPSTSNGQTVQFALSLHDGEISKGDQPVGYSDLHGGRAAFKAFKFKPDGKHAISVRIFTTKQKVTFSYAVRRVILGSQKTDTHNTNAGISRPAKPGPAPSEDDGEDPDSNVGDKSRLGFLGRLDEKSSRIIMMALGVCGLGLGALTLLTDQRRKSRG